MRQLSAVIALTFLLLCTSFAFAMKLPARISYQGRVVDSGGNGISGTVDLTMRLYRVDTGGAVLWTETHTAVPVDEGLFSVELGSINPLDQSLWIDAPDSLFLGVQVGADPEISPRTRLVPSPFAHFAGAIPGFVPGPDNISIGNYNFVAGDSNLVDGSYNVVGGGKNNQAYGEDEVSPDSAIDIETQRDGLGPRTNLLELNDTRQTGFGATIGGGIGNTAWGALSVVAGGAFNNSDGFCSAIGGGCANRTWHYATVGGGVRNRANGLGSVVGGGVYNESEGTFATIAGGGWSVWGNLASNNEVYDDYGSIGGGGNNKVGSNNMMPTDHVFSTISGGRGNVTPSSYAFIGGGDGNSGGADYGVIGGGEGNQVADNHSTVGGGYRNSATDPYTTVGGGDSCTADAFYATVSGGQYNHGANEYTAIGGGVFNLAQGHASAIGGGIENFTLNWATTIAGGELNEASGYHSAVVGGVTNRAFADSSYIGGGASNSIQGRLAAISGGGGNIATGTAAAIGGGVSNTATGDTSAVSGGWQNVSDGPSSTISGGRNNSIASAANRSAVGGGEGNAATGVGGAIAGGTNNATGPGVEATVPGGFQNSAQGNYSFAAGYKAEARHDCAFVWNDCCGAGTTGDFFASIVPNSFNVRASGGFFFATSCDTLNAAGIGTGVYLGPNDSQWSALCDRNAKRNIREVDAEDILQRVAQLEISRWTYKTQADNVDHIGPMAQDFYRQFRLGGNETRISTLDPSGVALAAIQALNKKTQELEKSNERIADLEAQIAELRSAVEKIVGDIDSD